MGNLVNVAIPLFVGIFVLLTGFRVIGKKPGEDPKFDEWHARFGLILKVAGAAAIGLAVIFLLKPWK